MSYRYVFRNTETGATVSAVSYALLPAARSLGIGATVVPNQGKHQLDSPWTQWECWEGTECIWHYTDDGEMRSGPRSA